MPFVALMIVVLLGRSSGTDEAALGTEAPPFSLPATDGSHQDLGEILSQGEALLYFSMGLGCDGCFLQIPEIEEDLAERGITLVSIMVDPEQAVVAEAYRFDITTPILIDGDRAVSEAYDMIGSYGHSDRPSHSFALVDQQSQISWVKHYAGMFVPIDDLLSDLQNRT